MKTSTRRWARTDWPPRPTTAPSASNTFIDGIVNTRLLLREVRQRREALLCARVHVGDMFEEEGQQLAVLGGFEVHLGAVEGREPGTVVCLGACASGEQQTRDRGFAMIARKHEGSPTRAKLLTVWQCVALEQRLDSLSSQQRLDRLLSQHCQRSRRRALALHDQKFSRFSARLYLLFKTHYIKDF